MIDNIQYNINLDTLNRKNRKRNLNESLTVALLCIREYTAVQIHTSAFSQYYGLLSPYISGRKCIPYKYPCHPFPAS